MLKPRFHVLPSAREAEPARMRLRVAANIGPVYCDEHGFAGDDVTLLCRMLDLPPLRQALSESGGELALIISDYVYDVLVLRRHSLAGPKSFRRVKAQVKRTTVHAWMYLLTRRHRNRRQAASAGRSRG